MFLKDKKYVIIGGGTGTFSVLQGLKRYTNNITAVVSMADSGGSAKKERDEWGLLPSSDIRKSLIALADVSYEDSLLLRKLFQYRYNSETKGLKGMTFGNLFLATLTKILKSQVLAIQKSGEFLRIKGSVLPVSMDQVDLVAEYEDGSVIQGEHFIDEPKHNGRLRIRKLYTKPKAHITAEVRDAISQGDYIIIGPGGFYTTVLANLVVDGVVEAVISAKGKKIFILNLMTEYGQTYGFTASTFINELDKYLPVKYLDFILMNDAPIPDEILQKYRRYHAQPITDDLTGKNHRVRIIKRDLLSKRLVRKEPGDSLKRSLIRHSSEKIARACMNL